MTMYSHVVAWHFQGRYSDLSWQAGVEHEHQYVVAVVRQVSLL
jgi:hypothetical protein